MSLREWQQNGWLKPHAPSRQEIADLYAVIERDLAASDTAGLDDDWRFAIAYNAALQVAATALKAAGYEVPKGGGAHHHTIESLRLTLGDDGTAVTMLQAFRAKRGGGVYESTGVATQTEIRELRRLAGDLFARLKNYIRTLHPSLDPTRP
jgi:hypothetical protein